MTRTCVLFGVVAALSVASGAHAAQPRTVAGWPVAAGAGSVHPGPGGGIVTITEAIPLGVEGHLGSSVASFRRSGAVRWVSTRPWGCGNCDDGPELPTLQPDGSYGPIGPDGNNLWGVSAGGVSGPTCVGARLANGTCVGHTTTYLPTEMRSIPGVAAIRAGMSVWEYQRPQLSWTVQDNFLVAPVVVDDSAGTVYTRMGPGFEPAGTSVPSRMIALDEKTGTLRWQADDADPQAPFASGVLALRKGSGLTRYSAAGTVLWANPAWTSEGHWIVVVDQARRRVYVSPRYPDRRRPQYVTALDADTGIELWRTAPRNRARLLSVGANGVVYAATDRPTGPALHALEPNGALRFRWTSTTSVTGASELGDGTIGVATTGAAGFSSGGLIWRLDPTRRSPSARRVRLSLSRTSFAIRCRSAGTCFQRHDYGTILHAELPTATTLRVRLLRRNGTIVSATTRLPAPAGTSDTRLFAGRGIAAGRYTVEVRGRGFVRRIPVTIL